jgi:hypothetical protein
VDGLGKRRGTYIHIGPKGLEELFGRDETLAVLDQVGEEIEDLGLGAADFLPMFLEGSRLGVELVVTESEAHTRRTPCCPSGKHYATTLLPAGG